MVLWKHGHFFLIAADAVLNIMGTDLSLFLSDPTIKCWGQYNTIIGGCSVVCLLLQKFMVGLNFADEKEATKFNQAVEAKLQEREKKASES